MSKVVVLQILNFSGVKDGLVERDIAKRQTASVYLKKLCEIGVLHEQSAGKEKLFVHPKLIQLMTQPAHSFEPYAGNSPIPQR